MKVLVVGGGGREHAIVKKIKENSGVEKIYALPGNGGIALDAECVAIGAKEIDKIVEFALSKKIDYAIVAPDDPLVLGLVDELNKVGIPCFGPNKRAAIIEGSKYISKYTEIIANKLEPTAGDLETAKIILENIFIQPFLIKYMVSLL